MKNIIILTITAFLLTACASQKSPVNWQGDSLSNLLETYGVPDNYMPLEDGNKIVEFSQNSKKGDNLACIHSFVIDASNTVVGGNVSGNCVS